jgi:hypothetical protein
VSLQQIVLGSSPEGVGGDSVREAFTKVNETFASLVTTFDVTANGTSIAIPFTFATAGGLPGDLPGDRGRERPLGDRRGRTDILVLRW